MDNYTIVAAAIASLGSGGIVFFVARTALAHTTTGYLSKIEGAASKADVEMLLKECVTKKDLEIAKLMLERENSKELTQTRHEIRNEVNHQINSFQLQIGDNNKKLDVLQGILGRIEVALSRVIATNVEQNEKFSSL